MLVTKKTEKRAEGITDSKEETTSGTQTMLKDQQERGSTPIMKRITKKNKEKMTTSMESTTMKTTTDTTQVTGSNRNNHNSKNRHKHP